MLLFYPGLLQLLLILIVVTHALAARFVRLIWLVILFRLAYGPNLIIFIFDAADTMFFGWQVVQGQRNSVVILLRFLGQDVVRGLHMLNL